MNSRQRAVFAAASIVGCLAVAQQPAPEKDRPVDLKIDWVQIPDGKFMMGSDIYPNAKPSHEVHVPSFLIAKTEGTVAQYKACVKAGVCSAPITKGNKACNSEYSNRDGHPINCITWSQAKTFAEWVGGRLPSEAEWEYAARSAGKDTPNFLGEGQLWGSEGGPCDKAVIWGDKCGNKGTAPVCSKPAGNTAQGLCDMIGNVSEWTEDYFHDSYLGAPNNGSAWEDPATSSRTARGSSWWFDYHSANALARFFTLPTGHSANVGVRPVKDLPKDSSTAIPRSK